MASSADADRLIVSKSGSPLYGRTDGLGVIPDAAGSSSEHDGLVAISNGDVARTLDPSLLCEVFEDFLGKALNVTDSVWATHDTSAAGTPILAIDADADNGAFEMEFDSTNEAQVLGLYWNDEQNIDSDQEPVMIIRLQLKALLDANDTLVFGLSSARNSTADSVANHAWFRIETGGTLLLESDDATTDNDDKAPDTAVTLSAGTYYEFMISCNAIHGASPTNAKFFYRAALGGDWTELKTAGVTFKVGADIALQPNVQLQKASGAQTTGILVDYVRLYWKRN